jgi:hypothetical protein
LKQNPPPLTKSQNALFTCSVLEYRNIKQDSEKVVLPVIYKCEANIEREKNQQFCQKMSRAGCRGICCNLVKFNHAIISNVKQVLATCIYHFQCPLWNQPYNAGVICRAHTHVIKHDK